jgi:B-box zinc finger
VWGNLTAGSPREEKLASTCTHHPDRPAIAVCMSCTKPVCQECATTRDGIHYCARCLPDLFAKRRESTPWLAWTGTLATSLGLLWVLLHLMVWVGVFVVELL